MLILTDVCMLVKMKTFGRWSNSSARLQKSSGRSGPCHRDRRAPPVISKEHPPAPSKPRATAHRFCTVEDERACAVVGIPAALKRVMSLPAKRRATYQDLLAVPPHLVAEIIDGELTTSPRPAPRHTRASSRLGGVLDGPFDRGAGGPGGWIILDEPELHHLGDVLVPDLAGWRR